jgi:hypothetical protein
MIQPIYVRLPVAVTKGCQYSSTEHFLFFVTGNAPENSEDTIQPSPSNHRRAELRCATRTAEVGLIGKPGRPVRVTEHRRDSLVKEIPHVIKEMFQRRSSSTHRPGSSLRVSS